MAGEGTDGAEDQHMTEYEKERLLRIRENQARLQALGIRRLAASPLLHQPLPAAAVAKRKQRNRSAVADDEYLPSDERGSEEDSSSASDEDYDEEEEIKCSSRSRQKGKKKELLNFGKSSKSTPIKGSAPTIDFVDDDTALQQAIALSLVGPSESSMTTLSTETSNTGMREIKATPCKKNIPVAIQDSAKNRKLKNQVKSRIQLTEDDVLPFFFSFDEVGKGYITQWDLERMATVNDFTWSDYEMSKMIHCFDSDGDGKISLEDFRAIVSRCNMLKEPGT